MSHGSSMLQQTERYLDLVHRGRNEWWRYLLGVALILFCWLVLGLLPYLVLSGYDLFDDMLVFVAVNVSILMMLAGLFTAMRVLHRRPLLSLVTPSPGLDWRRVGQGAAVWAVLALAIVALEHALYPGRYNLTFNPERFFYFALLVLALTPIQTTTEELLFRGYVMQGLGLVLRRPVAIAILSAAIFAAPHSVNPEVQEHGLLLMAGYFVIGLLLAAVTLRDGRLELAIGVHAVNNLMLALVANYEGSVLTTQPVFTARELDPAYTLASLIPGSLVFYWWFFHGPGAQNKR